MASGSSSTPFFGIREEDQNQIKQQQSTPTSSTAPTTTTQKKKRNLPGTPNPDAEVIALSPKTLMATNRFICEVCNKGFQREQNLQLHRRGHNLPWKLKQKTTKEVKRKVYLCPEPTCVHHDPSRALGDLTGIKKHFCRKHGEKKWKCDKCSKRYAVQSDWKAHSKTCGTREYRCDCGTLFSRRDSFITHRAFCDALAQESARLPTGLNTMGSHLYGGSNMGLNLSQVGSQMSSLQDQNHTSNDILRLGGAGAQYDHLISPSNSSFRPPQPSPASAFYLPSGNNQDYHEDSQSHHQLLQNKNFHGLMQLPELQSNPNHSSPAAAAAAANLFNLSFFSNSSTTTNMSNSSNTNNNNSNNHLSSSGLLMPEQFNSGNAGGEGTTLFSGNIMSDHMGNNVSSLYNTSVQNDNVLPQMSATALLQKAAQMGSTTSGNSSTLLRGFGSSSSSNARSDRPHMSANFRGSFSSGGGGENLRSQMENDSHLQDIIMNNFANGGSQMFGSGSNSFGGSGGHGQETSFAGFNSNRLSLDQQHSNANMSNMDEAKMHQNLSASLGGSDRLTRDFLGVGGIVRSVSGAISQREQHHGLDISSLDSEIKSATENRSFGSGNLQ
ncbi:indeterminate-domain 5, chloroplastic-like [Thalictrum thalictroides]|uniref:Indeterminate-domain 5, chloroplastic-like n=1 Tax=Thalictrum thalictroides TaxID=46969 RepID=A0A7J6WJG8_THATH|nr:indeterminate-domain 5, chloroplastic-like [Thalictrum thalictroides]